MILTEESNLKNLLVIGDRVLIKPKNQEARTKGGLYLPPGVQEKEKIRSGYIIKTGPGYPIPTVPEEDESWKPTQEKVNYMPLQVKAGDLAIFIQKGAYEVRYEGEQYFIVSQHAILMVERDEGLFE